MDETQRPKMITTPKQNVSLNSLEIPWFELRPMHHQRKLFIHVL